MPRYRLTLEYDGGPFVGWQRQSGDRAGNGAGDGADGGAVSVQGVIEAALARLDRAPDGGPALVQGAGRTDAGVHATGQVAHVDLARDWEPFRLSEAVNHHLRPAPVAVRRSLPRGSIAGRRDHRHPGGSRRPGTTTDHPKPGDQHETQI
ncbi:MAG: hypothetical protein AAFZ09_16370, partial [Pseudomonadota bacterium]